MARLVRAFGRRRGSRLHGIRFRLGLAMAVALLPILILGAFQANRAFEAQDIDQRADLQLAVERTSAAIIVLLLFLLVMNGLAIYLRNRFEKRW